METNNILTANILDLLFEGKNKKYGAYDLRITYNKRISFALGITSVAIIIFISIVTGSKADDIKNVIPPDIVVSAPAKDVEKEKILPMKNLVKAKPVKTHASAPPVIVKEKFVTEPSLEAEKNFDGEIDTKNLNEGSDIDIAPPVEIKESAIIEEPKGKTKDDKFTPIEIEASFNGDWGKYVKKEIEKNIEELTEAGESGTCIVKFMVSKDGSVSDVEAITMQGSKLAEVAVNAIRKGPKWIPARQNGREVSAHRQQPVTFKITD